MASAAKPTDISELRRQAYTFIEQLAVMFIVTATIVAGVSVAHKYGRWVGVGAGILAAALFAALVVLFYRWMWRQDDRQRQEMREKHRGIYRVNEAPSDQESVFKPDGAEIKTGDYGWEAGPLRKDGLIYLQGLTIEWTVVWHAGFRPDQIEWVAAKPNSQYDYWVPYWAEPPSLPPCPYPVLERETLTMGPPHHSNRYFTILTLYRPRLVKQTDAHDKLT